MRFSTDLGKNQPQRSARGDFFSSFEYFIQAQLVMAGETVRGALKQPKNFFNHFKPSVEVSQQISIPES